jgi:hypothetical protein
VQLIYENYNYIKSSANVAIIHGFVLAIFIQIIANI